MVHRQNVAALKKADIRAYHGMVKDSHHLGSAGIHVAAIGALKSPVLAGLRWTSRLTQFSVVTTFWPQSMNWGAQLQRIQKSPLDTEVNTILRGHHQLTSIHELRGSVTVNKNLKQFPQTSTWNGTIERNNGTDCRDAATRLRHVNNRSSDRYVYIVFFVALKSNEDRFKCLHRISSKG